MARDPILLGIVGGTWGLLVASFLTVFSVFVSAHGNGEPSFSTQVLLLTTVLGSFSGLVGGATTWFNERAGGLILVGGASLALSGWAVQESAKTPPANLASTALTTVFFFAWIALVLVGGLLALLSSMKRTRDKHNEE